MDFPGCRSLESHGATFSMCGVMNNLLVLLVPYMGDISEWVAEELSRAFKV